MFMVTLSKWPMCIERRESFCVCKKAFGQRVCVEPRRTGRSTVREIVEAAATGRFPAIFLNWGSEKTVELWCGLQVQMKVVDGWFGCLKLNVMGVNVSQRQFFTAVELMQSCINFADFFNFPYPPAFPITFHVGLAVMLREVLSWYCRDMYNGARRKEVCKKPCFYEAKERWSMRQVPAM